MGQGIFTSDGLLWKHSRELLRPNFARSQIDNPATLEPHVSALLEAIPRDGSGFDLQELFFRLTTEIAIDFLFGVDVAVSREYVSNFTKALDHLNRAAVRTAYFGRIMNIAKPFVQKDVDTAFDFIDHYIGLAIKDRKNYTLGRDEGERYVFLHEVVQRTQDTTQIRSEILNVLQAGRDTTASLLSHLWFTLARRPDVWGKLRAEIDDLNGEKPSSAALQEMKYLRAVLNEGMVYIKPGCITPLILLEIALRLYPVTPIIGRTARTDTLLPVGGGQDGKSPLLVHKHQTVIWSSYSMHRRKDIYGVDADEFRPERWETLRPGWAYLPFNG